MSTNRSRPAGARTHRRPVRQRFTVAALCALSCLGDFPLNLRAVAAQDAPPAKAAEVSPNSAVANQDPNEGDKKAKGDKKKQVVASSLDAQLERRGTLTLREATLADCMLAIQKTWVGLNISYDNDALQRVQVTANLTDMPLKEILDTILPPNNFGYRRQGNALVILPSTEIGGGDPNQKRELIQMEFVTPGEVQTSLQELMSPKGKVFPVPSAKAMMVVDYPENIQAVREYIQDLDQQARKVAERAQADERQRQQPTAPSTTGFPDGPSASSGAPDVQPVEQTITTVLSPTFVLADSLVDAIQSQVADGNVVAIAETNELVVTGTQSAVRTASLLVKQLDVPRKQVRISVLMYDIRVDALEQLGVNWRNAGKGRINSSGIARDVFDLHSSPMDLGASSSTSSTSSSSSSTSTGTTTPTTPTTGTSTTTGTTGTSTATASGVGSFITSAAPNIAGSVLTLTHLSRHFDLSAVFMALDQTDGARLLANPSVLCYDRKESQTKIISEIPVQQLTQTDQGGNIGTTTFREAGVTLIVTPWIGDDGLILLNVAPEFSVLTGFQAGQPIIDRRSLTQWVKVQTGDTLVLGGLRRQNQLETVSGIPGLMNLKYIGGLFRSHRTSIEESELVTFIHTEIVDADYKGLLREQVAAEVVNETLDRIPIAGHSPYVPPCNDPYCPIHNPRPKYWVGNMLEPGPHTFGHPAGAPPIIQPYRDYEPLPPVQGQRIEAAGNGNVSPTLRSAPATTPLRPTPPADGPAPNETKVNPQNPPPVKIDENARRVMGNRLVLFRLPKVTPDPTPQRLPGVEGAPVDESASRIAKNPTVRATTPSPQQPKPPPQRAPTGRGGLQELLR